MSLDYVHGILEGKQVYAQGEAHPLQLHYILHLISFEALAIAVKFNVEVHEARVVFIEDSRELLSRGTVEVEPLEPLEAREEAKLQEGAQVSRILCLERQIFQIGHRFEGCEGKGGQGEGILQGKLFQSL